MERERRLERETGIEPATNSLEGCDSTTELLPPSRRSLRASPLRRARPRAPVLRFAYPPARPVRARPSVLQPTPPRGAKPGRRPRAALWTRKDGRGGFEPP